MSRILFFILCFCYSICANSLSKNLKSENILGKEYNYLIKSEMYGDRFCLLLKDYNVLIIDPTKGVLAEIRHTESTNLKNAIVSINRYSVKIKGELIKYYWIGDQQYKDISSTKEKVGEIEFEYKFKKDSILFHSKALCKTRYSMNPYFQIKVFEFEQGNIENDVFYKKNYKRSITNLHPYIGNPINIMMDDDNTSYHQKVKDGKINGGYKKITVYNRQDYKSLEIVPKSNFSEINLKMSSNFLGIGNYRFNIFPKETSRHERFEYKEKGRKKDSLALKDSNKMYVLGGGVKIK